MIPTAHAGHWLTGLLYLAPVAIVVIVLAWQGHKERHNNAEHPEGDSTNTTRPVPLSSRAVVERVPPRAGWGRG